MTNFERIKSMSEEEFADWLEDFAEAYVAFWLPDIYLSVRENDKQIQLDMLREEYTGDEVLEF